MDDKNNGDSVEHTSGQASEQKQEIPGDIEVLKTEHNQYDNRKQGRRVSTWIYLLSLLIVGFVSAFATNLYLTGRTPLEAITNQTQSLSRKEIRILQQTFNTLITDYIGDVPREDLVNGAIEGMTRAVKDPYTQYLLNQDAETLDMTIEGSFEGIGAEIIESDNFIRIVSPIKGSPAEKAGLQPNDIILSVDNKSLEGMSANEAVALIRGEAGTEVVLEIKRGENIQQVTVKRDTIPIQTVYGEILANDASIGHIQITNFSAPTYDELVKTITDLRKQGAQRFIVDVRGNPGGLLPSALRIANMFLQDGEIIMRIQEKGQDPLVYDASDKTYGDFQVDEPVVLLVDGGSASASEILAGAMQQSADIPIIGAQTFGKGTVQTIIPVSESAELKVTIAKWLTPDGTWINEKGIKPDQPVELPSYANLTLINTTQVYQVGDESEAVHNIEQILSVLGYLDNKFVDSVYDDATAEAVSQVQSENDLKENGMVDDSTAFTLIQLIRNKLAENDSQLEAALKAVKVI